MLYFKAEQKYVTVRTATRSFIMDGALSDLESRYGERFLRIHRNALVARARCGRWKSTTTPTRAKAGPCACRALPKCCRSRAGKWLQCAKNWRADHPGQIKRHHRHGT